MIIVKRYSWELSCEVDYLVLICIKLLVWLVIITKLLLEHSYYCISKQRHTYRYYCIGSQHGQYDSVMCSLGHGCPVLYAVKSIPCTYSSNPEHTVIYFHYSTICSWPWSPTSVHWAWHYYWRLTCLLGA